MPRWSRWTIVVAGLLLMTAAQLGAIGSHALTDRLTPRQLDAWDWAVEYQFYLALGLILVALLATHLGNLIKVTAALFVVGIVLFCGSIYVTSLGGPSALGQVAPLGGGSFMLGWLVLAVAGFLSLRTPKD